MAKPIAAGDESYVKSLLASLKEEGTYLNDQDSDQPQVPQADQHADLPLAEQPLEDEPLAQPLMDSLETEDQHTEEPQTEDLQTESVSPTADNMSAADYIASLLPTIEAAIEESVQTPEHDEVTEADEISEALDLPADTESAEPHDFESAETHAEELDDPDRPEKAEANQPAPATQPIQRPKREKFELVPKPTGNQYTIAQLREVANLTVADALHAYRSKQLISNAYTAFGVSCLLMLLGSGMALFSVDKFGVARVLAWICVGLSVGSVATFLYILRTITRNPLPPSGAQRPSNQ
ncbi:MAG: hypothetical protein KDB27_07835 [Planctomycetales bacterium]|nr:hypothetical protein [Planctomycetales bacterium]